MRLLDVALCGLPALRRALLVPGAAACSRRGPRRLPDDVEEGRQFSGRPPNETTQCLFFQDLAAQPQYRVNAAYVP
jgi:hypothetical protein